jgi:hypothetical protein
MRHVPTVTFALLLLAAAIPVYLHGCAGPRPTVAAVALDPSPLGLVPRATVRNSGGSGEVQVRFRIRERATGRALAAEASAEVDRGQEVEIRSRDAIPVGDYAIDAEAQAPPQ